MGRNMKGLLAGIVLLIVFSGISGYDYLVQHQHAAVVWALIAGILLVGIDWKQRRPGHPPNKTVMAIAYAIGALVGPLAHLLWGENAQFSIVVYLSALCLPGVFYILIVTFIVARKSPGYWSR